jgi:hypothetical protein
MDVTEKILEIYYKEIPKNEKLFLCSIEDPTPIAFFNVFEEGDIWVKIKGCESCSDRGRKLCCGECKMATSLGCLIHLEQYPRGCRKPFSCITIPTPEKCMSYCSLEFKSVKGSKEGKIRKVRDKGNTFEEKS